MPRRKRSVYWVSYFVLGIVLTSFFAHNMFMPVDYDVLHVDQTFTLWGMSWHVKDFFLLYDAKEVNAYGDVPRMDVQHYFHKLGLKTIMFLLAFAWYYTIKAFNLLAADVPGRTFNKMPHYLLILIALFGYDLLDFILYASQTDWQYELVATGLALAYVTYHVKK